MSNTNPLPSLKKRVSGRAIKSPNGKPLAREILWASLAIVFLVLATPVEAPAAELGAINAHAKAYKHYKKVAYYDCRTGWWQTYWDGMRQPHWATRCR